jgi:hypothetical protein
MAHSPITFIILPAALKKAAEREAKAEDRPLASMLRLLIKEALQTRHGRKK